MNQSGRTLLTCVQPDIETGRHGLKEEMEQIKKWLREVNSLHERQENNEMK